VLERRDFVEAAPTLPADPRIRLPPASPHRCDGKATKVFHLRSEQQRLVAHYEDHYNLSRPHRTLQQASPLTPLPEPANLDQIRVRQRDRLGGIIHEYSQVA
jgi:hypothetical protein